MQTRLLLLVGCLTGIYGCSPQPPSIPEDSAGHLTNDRAALKRWIEAGGPVELSWGKGFYEGEGEGEYLPCVKVGPSYALLAADRPEGLVVLEYWVGKDGTVSDVIVSRSTNNDLEPAALEYLKNIRLEPCRSPDGQYFDTHGFSYIQFQNEP